MYKNKNYHKDYYILHKEESKKRAKEWYKLNKEKVLKRHHENLDILRIYKRKRYKDKREMLLNKVALYRNKNKSKYKEADRERHKEFYYNIAKVEAPKTIKHYTLWSNDEKNYLYDNFKDMTILELAKRLGRTYGATERMIRKLGLVKLKSRIKLLIKQK